VQIDSNLAAARAGRVLLPPLELVLWCSANQVVIPAYHLWTRGECGENLVRLALLVQFGSGEDGRRCDIT
jgi:hypothetical protein